MKDHLLEVQILDYKNAVRYIPVIREFTKESFMQIKIAIQKQQSVIVCKYTKEPEKLVELNNLLKKLLNKGAKIKLLQNFRDELVKEVDICIVDNLVNRNKNISEEVERIIDLEVGE